MGKKGRRNSQANQNKSKHRREAEETLRTPEAEVEATKKCVHLRKAAKLSVLQSSLPHMKLGKCSFCEKGQNDEAGVCMCLRCGKQGCDRYSEDKHSMSHYDSIPSHCLTVNLQSMMVWCYSCDIEVSVTPNTDLHECIKVLLKALRLNAPYEPALDAVTSMAFTEPMKKSEVISSKLASNTNKMKGLVNLGNTCFFNAVMQNLFQTELFHVAMAYVNQPDYSQMIATKNDLPKISIQVETPPGSLVTALSKLLCEYKSSSLGPLTPKFLFSEICKKAPRFKGFQQQDSQELLRYLLDSVKTEQLRRIKIAVLKSFEIKEDSGIKSLPEKKKEMIKEYVSCVTAPAVDSLFSGTLDSIVVCHKCHKESRVTESFLDLSLSLNTPQSEKGMLKTKTGVDVPQRNKGNNTDHHEEQENMEEDEIPTKTQTLSKHQMKKAAREARRKRGKKGGKRTLNVSTSEDDKLESKQENVNATSDGSDHEEHTDSLKDAEVSGDAIANQENSSNTIINKKKLGSGAEYIISQPSCKSVSVDDSSQVNIDVIAERESTENQSGLVTEESGSQNENKRNSGILNKDAKVSVTQNKDAMDSGIQNEDARDSGIQNENYEQDSGIKNEEAKDSGIQNENKQDSGIPNQDARDSGIQNQDAKDSGIQNGDKQDSGIQNGDKQDSGIQNQDARDSGIQNEDEQDSGIQNEDARDSGIQNQDAKDSGIQNENKQDSGIQNQDARDSGIQNENDEQDSGIQNEDARDSGIQNEDARDSGIQNEDEQDSGIQNEDARDSGIQNQDAKDSGIQNENKQDSGIQNQDARDSGIRNENDEQDSGIQSEDIKDSGLHNKVSKDFELEELTVERNFEKKSGIHSAIADCKMEFEAGRGAGKSCITVEIDIENNLSGEHEENATNYTKHVLGIKTNDMSQSLPSDFQNLKNGKCPKTVANCCHDIISEGKFSSSSEIQQNLNEDHLDNVSYCRSHGNCFKNVPYCKESDNIKDCEMISDTAPEKGENQLHRTENSDKERIEIASLSSQAERNLESTNEESHANYALDDTLRDAGNICRKSFESLVNVEQIKVEDEDCRCSARSRDCNAEILISPLNDGENTTNSLIYKFKKVKITSVDESLTAKQSKELKNESLESKRTESDNFLELQDKADLDRKELFPPSVPTLGPAYVSCSTGECSVQSCLSLFCSPEILKGKNKFACQECSKRKKEGRHKKKEESSSTDDDETSKGATASKVKNQKEYEKTVVYTEATKQMLISYTPPVLTLHFKRFRQVGFGLRKVPKHVDFPLVLDLAPFCRRNGEVYSDSKQQVLYSLIGVVEHSGGLNCGHYTACIKLKTSPTYGISTDLSHVKDFASFIEGMWNNQRKINAHAQPRDGQWYHVSDSRVSLVTEARVLKSQAYMLFYERLPFLD